MKNYSTLFADLDGTLIETISGETFPKGVWDMKVRFDVLDKIKELKLYNVFIISNQGGIEKGFVNRYHFESKMEYIENVIREYCDCMCFSTYCDTNDKNDPYRKPNTQMLEDCYNYYLNKEDKKDKSKFLMIGDASGKEGQFSDTDKKTAENFSIDYMDVEDFVKCKIK